MASKGSAKFPLSLSRAMWCASPKAVTISKTDSEMVFPGNWRCGTGHNFPAVDPASRGAVYNNRSPFSHGTTDHAVHHLYCRLRQPCRPRLRPGLTPDLRGTWTAPFKSVIYGHNSHHPGDQSVTDPPRVRDITFTLKVSGQDGRVIWGESWSKPERASLSQ